MIYTDTLFTYYIVDSLYKHSSLQHLTVLTTSQFHYVHIQQQGTVVYLHSTQTIHFTYTYCFKTYRTTYLLVWLDLIKFESFFRLKGGEVLTSFVLLILMARPPPPLQLFAKRHTQQAFIKNNFSLQEVCL